MPQNVARPATFRVRPGAPLASGLCDYWMATGRRGLQNLACPAAVGTLNNFAADPLIATPYGWGLDFDGADDTVSIAAAKQFEIGTGDFTLLALVKPDAFTGSYNMIASGMGGSYSYLAFTSGGDIAFDTAGNGILRASGFASAGQWIVVGARRSSGTVQIWANGRYTGASKADGTTIAGLAYLGTYTGSDHRFDGPMVLVARWRRALGDAEMQRFHADPFAPLRAVGFVLPAASAATSAIAGSAWGWPRTAGTLSGAAVAAGSSRVLLRTSGARSADGALAGSLRISERAQAIVTGAGVLAGAARATVTARGSAAGAAVLAGTTRTSLRLAGSVTGAAALVGSTRSCAAVVATALGAGALRGRVVAAATGRLSTTAPDLPAGPPSRIRAFGGVRVAARGGVRGGEFGGVRVTSRRSR